MRLRIKALTDWTYTDNDRLVGGFTNEVLDEGRTDRAAWSRAQRG